MNDAAVILIWPAAAVMAALLLVGGLLARFVPFYRTLLASQAHDRYRSLDGLRGYLAFGVFLCHGATFYLFFKLGAWDLLPDHGFYVFLRSVPLVMFFMITGLLFWSKAMRKPVRAGELFKGRLLRLMPLYFAMVAVVLVMAAIESHFQLHEPIAKLAKGAAKLIVPGMNPWPSLNGTSSGMVLMMSWTMKYSLGFYLILPMLAFFVPIKRFIALCVVSFAACLYYGGNVRHHFLDPNLWIIFLLGMIAAQILPRLPKPSPAALRWLGAPVLICLALAALIPPSFSERGYTVLPAYLILGVAFFCIAYGSDVFGLLTMPAARLLGTISYSVYLLHMTILYLVLETLNHYMPVGSMGALAYWSVVGGTGVVIVLVGSVSYRLLEHPFFAADPRTAKPAPKPAAKRTPTSTPGRATLPFPFAASGQSA